MASEYYKSRLEYEQPVSRTSTLSFNIGIGYNGSYPNLSETSFESAVLYAIAPFADIQLKRYYNLHRRAKQKKATVGNSGNFISL